MHRRHTLLEAIRATWVVHLAGTGPQPLVPFLATKSVAMLVAQPAGIQADRTVGPPSLDHRGPACGSRLVQQATNAAIQPLVQHLAWPGPFMPQFATKAIAGSAALPLRIQAGDVARSPIGQALSPAFKKGVMAQAMGPV